MIKKQNILFRTSGGSAHNKELGFGHIYRCINLAKQLRPNKIYFLLEDHNNVKRILMENGFKDIHSLKKNIDVGTDITETINIIKNKKIDIAIIDIFKVKVNYVKKIKENVKTVVISDLEKINYPGDLVVNGFNGFRNSIVKNSYNSKCLLGPFYQILNDKFYNKLKITKKNTLLITFGGFDDKNIIEKILFNLYKLQLKISVRIILGPGTIYSNKLKQLEKKYTGNLSIIQKTNNMYNEIAKSKYGLCSGGITSYEFVSMGVPTAIISQVKHQLKTARNWEKLGLAINLGLIKKNDLQIKKFLNDVSKGKKILNLQNKIMVDGKGAKRVAQEILKIE